MRGKETGMRTFDGFMVVFTEGLVDLRALEPTSGAYREQERLLGRYCYEAEEYLPATELRLLRGTLGISESKWRRYKMVFIDGS
jgi:hypothetical protein